MRIIGTVGLPGSGKGEAAAVASEVGVPVVTMGDVIRDACRARGLDPSEHHGEVAAALREEEGETAVVDRTVDRIRERHPDADTVLVDGLRAPVEAETFQAAFGDGFLLVAVEAPFEIRASRLADRGREATDRDREKLRERETRELGFGMGEVIDDADVSLDNTGSLSGFRDRVQRLLTEGIAAVAGDDAVTVADDARIDAEAGERS